MSTTLNACQAVTLRPPAEYQGRNEETSRPRPPRAPTSSPPLRFRTSVAVAAHVLLHLHPASDRDRAACDQAQDQSDLDREAAAEVIEQLVEDQQGADAGQQRR